MNIFSKETGPNTFSSQWRCLKIVLVGAALSAMTYFSSGEAQAGELFVPQAPNGSQRIAQVEQGQGGVASAVDEKAVVVEVVSIGQKTNEVLMHQIDAIAKRKGLSGEAYLSSPEREIRASNIQLFVEMLTQQNNGTVEALESLQSKFGAISAATGLSQSEVEAAVVAMLGSTLTPEQVLLKVNAAQSGDLRASQSMQDWARIGKGMDEDWQRMLTYLLTQLEKSAQGESSYFDLRAPEDALIPARSMFAVATIDGNVPVEVLMHELASRPVSPDVKVAFRATNIQSDIDPESKPQELLAPNTQVEHQGDSNQAPVHTSFRRTLEESKVTPMIVFIVSLVIGAVSTASVSFLWRRKHSRNSGRELIPIRVVLADLWTNLTSSIPRTRKNEYKRSLPKRVKSRVVNISKEIRKVYLQLEVHKVKKSARLLAKEYPYNVLKDSTMEMMEVTDKKSELFRLLSYLNNPNDYSQTLSEIKRKFPSEFAKLIGNETIIPYFSKKQIEVEIGRIKADGDAVDKEYLKLLYDLKNGTNRVGSNTKKYVHAWLKLAEFASQKGVDLFPNVQPSNKL